MKHKKNNIDLLIETLAVEFSKIPNFQFVNTDEDANDLFNFIIRRYSEINDFEVLYMNYYIPASSKSIVDGYNEIRNSKYRRLLNVSKDDLKENYYETIRLGYVALFHKIENFKKELIIQANRHFNNFKENTTSIQQYIKERFSYNIEKDWKIENIYVEKVNWICNCVKHRDGFPQLDTKSIFAYKFPKTEKIKIEKSEFKEDINSVREYYLQETKEIFLFGIYKMLQEMFEEEKEFLESNNDKHLQFIENREKLEDNIEKLIELKRKN